MASQIINLIQKTKDWICVEKPTGISVHNEPGRDLISLLKEQLDQSPEILQPVHRLDKETSGLILMATTPASLTRLSDLFARGRVKKQYMALVHGNFSQDQEKGCWEIPLSKQAGGRQNPQGSGNRQRAVTRYKVVDQSLHYALLEIDLLTGRKHQIRRHTKLAGHPVVGDTRYGSPRSIAFLREKRGFLRMALHAFQMSFQDHDTQVDLRCDPLPAEIQDLIASDRETAD